MLEIKAIRAAAEAATPGPWMAAGPSFGEPLPKYINCVVVENEDGDVDDVCIAPIGCDAISTSDLTYIATANPTTVIALCDEMERLRKNEKLLDEAFWYIDATGDAYGRRKLLPKIAKALGRNK